MNILKPNDAAPSRQTRRHWNQFHTCFTIRYHQTHPTQSIDLITATVIMTYLIRHWRLIGRPLDMADLPYNVIPATTGTKLRPIQPMDLFCDTQNKSLWSYDP
jgi:hypothetical protein